MCKYLIKPYEPGFEEEQVKVGLEVVKNWVWPFQNNLESLRNLYSSPDFDSETAFFCFKEDKMIGFTSARIGVQEGVVGPSIKQGEQLGASLALPRVLPNNEEAEDLLMEKILEILKSKNVPFILARVSTMHTNSIELARKWGFKEHKDYPLGYKLYFHYVLEKGKIEDKTVDVDRFDSERDIDDCVISVSNFFKSSKEKARNDIINIDSSDDLVSHLVIRKDGDLEGYCYALPNSLNKDIIATFHLEASNEEYLKQLLVQVIDECLEKGGEYFLVDVIGELLKFKNVFTNLGFDKVATWGIFEKVLS
ncbi:MAG: hypothetical protein KAU62_12010 [Candidatus Heimdallarchaeota archaeon]|nr:hypothetical protein [Candidatus Heimdallarchaeota archaeon]MCK4611872.1 hypothetical protein [Candidatus Heimdallarchaeota archaeon]